MRFFDPEEGNMKVFSEACELLEERLFQDGVHGTCDYCHKTVLKWGMSFSLKTGKLSCGCAE